jgi:membrane protein DedA with SNARE-associated domain
LRATDYLTATFGAMFVFAGALLLLGLLAGVMADAVSGPGVLAIPVAVFVLALAAATSSFRATNRRARRKRGESRGA